MHLSIQKLTKEVTASESKGAYAKINSLSATVIVTSYIFTGINTNPV